MSWLKMEKKKLPAAKKAWKRFTYILKSKLQGLRNSKALKTTNINRPITAAHYIHHHHYQGQEGHICFAAIRVDAFYEEPGGAEAEGRNRSMRMEEQDYIAKMESMDDDESEGSTCASTTTLPQEVLLHGVDARAEEFINNFRQHLKLQREKSIEDYYEMLGRSI